MTTKITEKNISNLANAGVNWQSVVVADGSTGLTAVAGRGYFINTTSGAITVTLPTSPNVGDVIVLKDYARTWGTNNVTISSTLLDGETVSQAFFTSGQTVTLVRMDNTKGWSLVNEDTTTNIGASYVAATGGTITTSGNFKIHTFTGDGSFVVATAGNPIGSDKVDYLVVAGGGSGGIGNTAGGAGGGAGGYRTTFPSPGCNAGSFPITATTYPITVGGGGAAKGPGQNGAAGTSGSNSVFSTITSAGGGAGGGHDNPGSAGGSGGGGVGGGPRAPEAGKAGNTPPTSPSQGNPGGTGGISTSNYPSGGGGGAGGAAPNIVNATSPGGPGGVGVQNNIDGNNYYWAGGGGGEGYGLAGGDGGIGGGGGGSASGSENGPVQPAGSPGGSSINVATAGTPVIGGSGGANSGGGGGGAVGGGAPMGGPGTSGAGGKGIVIIRYKFQ